MTKNRNLSAARNSKNDEFYTQLSDIETELENYTEHFRGKSVLCNCDDPRRSKFFQYFSDNFEHLGLKKLTAACYYSQQIDMFSKNNPTKAVWQVYGGDINEFDGDGDFRSSESVALLKDADIVVSNPPFSLFREYVAQLVKFQKKFLILGNMNAISYKEIFPQIQNNKIWIGVNNRIKNFIVPDKGVVNMGNVFWFTNLSHNKRLEKINLVKEYNEGDYPKYDGYDAIEVAKVNNIPKDYDGRMGVPISFLDKYNPEQFEILGIDVYMRDNPFYGHRFRINGKEKYARILIRHKRLTLD